MVWWLRHYATNRQVTGSILDGVIGIFQWHNPTSHTMALGSTQPLTEMSTRCISWGKGSRCIRLTTLPPSCAVVMKSGNLNFPEPSGPLQACNRSALPLPLPFFACIIVQASYSCPAYWLQNHKECLFSICNITFLHYALCASVCTFYPTVPVKEKKGLFIRLF